MIYKTLYGNPLDLSKMYDIVMNDEIMLTYLLTCLAKLLLMAGALYAWAIRMENVWTMARLFNFIEF